jgi:hypothetical protein
VSQRCRTYWGSHGCGLERQHADADRRHQCGDAPSETNPDGLCSVVERAADGSWTVRFSTLKPDEVDGQAFPVTLYGPDFPPFPAEIEL